MRTLRYRLIRPTFYSQTASDKPAFGGAYHNDIPGLMRLENEITLIRLVRMRQRRTHLHD